MNKAILLMMVFAVFSAISTAAIVYQDDFEDRTPGSGAGGWNWSNGACAHTATNEQIEGNMVRQQSAAVNNTGTAAENTRFGSKWDITVSGNTSSDPADYTIEFDIRNVQGNWNPHRIELWVVTNNPAQGSDQYGRGFPTLEVTQEQGWVHVKFSLAEATKNWWQGANWDLTNSTWALEIGGPEYPGVAVEPGQSWTQIFLLDNIRITMGADTGPHDPSYVPQNEDGTVGQLLAGNARFRLAWMAGGDPNITREYPVNPDIRGYYIYISKGIAGDDPNIHYLAYKAQVHNADPYLTDPYNLYPAAPSWITRPADTTIYWQVEQAMDNGAGQPLPAGDPNNIWGPLWSFKTISITPYIMVHPKSTVADMSGNASFSAKGSASATHYRWYKVGSPDVEVAEGTLASDKTTTLNITGATLAHEGQYYCIVYYNNPDTGGTPSAPSNPARLWTSRLIGYWKFDGDTTDSVGEVVPGAVAHDGVMKTGAPSFAGEAAVGTNALRIYSTGSFLLLPDAEYFNFYQGGFTISLWYKEYAPQPPGNVFLSKFDTGTSGWLYRSYDGANSGGAFIIEGADTSVGYPAIPDNQWNMLTVTYDPVTTTLRSYANGELRSQTTVDLSALPVPASQVKVGGEDTWGTDVTGDIAIDELRMYSYPITTVEIAQNYLAVSGADWVCNNELYDLQYDFDGNCRVDLADFAALAADWLDSYRIYPD
jgi:hypothetical protein